METNKLTSGNYFKANSVIHLGLTIGIGLFILIIGALLLSSKSLNNISDSGKTFRYIVPLLTFAGIFVSNNLFKKKLTLCKESIVLGDKMNKYRGALIVRYAVLEFSAIFGIIIAFITNDISFLIFSSIPFILMLLIRPTLKSAIRDLSLDESECSILENPKTEIVLI